METGLVVGLGSVIGHRRLVVSFAGVVRDVRETWFLAHTDANEIDTSGFSADEAATIVEHRWWTVDELEATTDLLTPRGLAVLVGRLLRDGPPREPLTLDV